MLRPAPLDPPVDAWLSGVAGSSGGGGMVIAGADGAIRFAGGPAAEALALAPGRSLREALPELGAELEPALAGGAPGPAHLVTRGAVTVRAQLAPLRGVDGVVGVVCTLSEVGEREELVRRMRAGEASAVEREAIFNSMSDGLWVCDAEAKVLAINPASARLNAVEPAQVIGRNMKDLVEEGLFDRSVTLEVIRSRRPMDMLQSRGGRRLVVTGTPVFGPSGELVRVVVTERDVTEIETLQRELEEQEALRDRFRDEMLERQTEELESTRVVARSPAMQRALRQAVKVAGVDSTVLILGESGVGKGLLADLIHKHSSRAQKPLVKVNCGAIPDSLVEAELFGYEKGAFTGAQEKGKAGYFEVAEGGTLFLDEIAELPLSSQVKLLRFLEDRRISRVGGTASREVDVRVLAATHRDLHEMVEQGLFRLDLFYRLNVIPITIPPLRERGDCILPMLRHYVDLYGARLGAKRRLSRAAVDALLSYAWPGNVRELMNLCERLVVMSDTEVIDVGDLPANVLAMPGTAAVPAVDEEITLQEAIERAERVVLLRARQRYRSQTDMARALGVNQSTIARKLKRLGVP